MPVSLSVSSPQVDNSLLVEYNPPEHLTIIIIVIVKGVKIKYILFKMAQEYTSKKTVKIYYRFHIPVCHINTRYVTLLPMMPFHNQL